MHKIRELRKKVGWSQGALADAAGTSRQFISLLESRKNLPTGKVARRLVRAFRFAGVDLTYEDFFGSADPGSGICEECGQSGVLLSGRCRECWGVRDGSE